MEQPLVSIIIPVYKVEKYIHRCLDSVKKQTYRNIEVILVDDGSPDRCPKICDEYAVKDKRFHVIHKENGGVSSARNAGLDYVAETNSMGYISFVDSDDWLPVSAIEKLIEKSYDSDLICGNYESILISGKKPHKTMDDFSFETNPGDLFERIGAFSFGCGKLYKAEIILKTNLRFHTDMSICEDNLFLHEYISYCKRISTCSDFVYFYSYLGNSSATMKYHPDLNKCQLAIYEARCHWNNSDVFLAIEQLQGVQLLFHSLMHYINHLPHNWDTLINKIRETCEMYKNALNKVNFSVLKTLSNEFAKFYLMYSNCLIDNNYEQIALYCKGKEEKNRRKIIKRRIRKILLPFEQFFVFRLQWFYK